MFKSKLKPFLAKSSLNVLLAWLMIIIIGFIISLDSVPWVLDVQNT